MSTQTFTRDREDILSEMRERNEQFLAAGRRTGLEFAEALEQTLSAVADAQEKLAETSEVEWLSRLLHAQATFTRSMGDASAKFTRELIDAT
jgi:hypothetical protein